METVVNDEKLMQLVASNINAGWWYKRIMATCRLWYKVIKTPERDNEFIDIISTKGLRNHPELLHNYVMDRNYFKINIHLCV